MMARYTLLPLVASRSAKRTHPFAQDILVAHEPLGLRVARDLDDFILVGNRGEVQAVAQIVVVGTGWLGSRRLGSHAAALRACSRRGSTTIPHSVPTVPPPYPMGASLVPPSPHCTALNRALQYMLRSVGR
jgi:hypothetical protein